jgi:hypothetical protein
MRLDISMEELFPVPVERGTRLTLRHTGEADERTVRGTPG